MNDMTPIQNATPLERFSAGEITRRQLGDLLGEPVSFGEMLMMLHEAHLPLPQYGRPYNAEAIDIVAQLAKRKSNG